MIKLDKNKKYLLACSFGPDSMYLFNQLFQSGYSFDVAHVNYHLRDESNDEERLLRKFCKEHLINLFVFDNKEKIEKNIEAKCREIRYHFFQELYEENRYDALLVAHNEDDLIETYLMQKRRKNLVNYYGIAQETIILGMKVVRPILDKSKKNIVEFNNQNRIPYCIDKTNLLPIYERNVLRLNVVSKFSNVERKNVLEEIKKENETLQNIHKKILKIDNELDQIISLSDIELAYFINYKVKEINTKFVITYKQIKTIREELLSNKDYIDIYVCKNNLLILKDKQHLFFIDVRKLSFEPFVISKPCIVDNDLLFADLLIESEKRSIHSEDYPITVRPAISGDKYKIKDYYVSIRRLFIDWKVPKHLRKLWPIFVNKDGKIIYIPRYKSNFNINESPRFYVKEQFTLKKSNNSL